MGYQNIYARQQLLEVYNELFEELKRVQFTKEDDELDQELKHGARGALEYAIGVIDEKITELKNEHK